MTESGTESPKRQFKPPSIEEIVSDPAYAAWVDALSRPLATALIREAVAEVKAAADADAELLDRRVRAYLDNWLNKAQTPVVNATGVLVHTNLGRSPLGERFFVELAGRASGYGVLEYDLDRGERGKRGQLVHRLIAQIAHAEAGLAVNNCAGAVLLMLAQHRGQKVIVSRGELVQIGGGFRIPDIMAQSGAQLVEIGTTNKTSLKDYEDAITSDTGAILKVHQSNFAMSGFVADATTQQLAGLCRERGVHLLEDLGSGAVHDLSQYGLPKERRISDAVRDGADVVCVSGDKLLGGPQAGLIAGRLDAVNALARHPLYRALRPDKLTLTGLEITLRAHLSGEAEEALPLYRLLAAKPEALARRAESLTADVGDDRVRIAASEAVTGGGTLPGAGTPSVALVVMVDSPDRAAAQLRQRTIPVIARVQDGELWFDLKTVPPEQDALLQKAISDLLGE
jgi:L-seryl-tRNA(Ser) seleniumtransferase